MSSLVSTTTPLAANATWTSSVNQLTRAVGITGTVIADEPGTLYVDQSGDGTDFDVTTEYIVPANTGIKIDTPVVAQWFRVRYTNGATAQTTLRLYVDIRDPYGDFLIAQSGPSAGAQWLVLYLNPGQGYQVVGRFAGTDGWNANGNAAIYQNKTGQYASVPVTDFTVTVETLQTTTEHNPASF